MRRIILDLFAGPGGWSHALTVPGARASAWSGTAGPAKPGLESFG